MALPVFLNAFRENMKKILEERRFTSRKCDGRFETEPRAIFEFAVDVAAKEVVLKFVIIDKNPESQIRKLTNCTIFDKNNWTCGVDWHGNDISPSKLKMVDGVLTEESGGMKIDCPLQYKKIR